MQKQLDSAAAELAELKAKQEGIEARSQLLDKSPFTKRQDVDAFISKVLPLCTAMCSDRHTRLSFATWLDIIW